MLRKNKEKEVAVVMVFIKQEKMDSENNRQCVRDSDNSPAGVSRVDYNQMGALLGDYWVLSQAL